MATVIKLKNSSTPGAIPAPSSLQPGEVALNLSDSKIFVKDTLNVVKTVGSGTVEGLADVDFSTAPTNNQILSFDAATSKWKPITSGSAIASTDDLAEGSTNLYYTTARANSDFDTRLTTKTTDSLSEGSNNLYYKTSRVNTAFDARLATKSTSDVSEGTNLYYTTARANSDFDTRLATKNTDSLAEGSTNLYYTDARADARAQIAVNALIDSAPGALDTLNELAAALGDDPNFATTVNNTLSGKEDTIVAGTTAQYYRGDKSWQTLNTTAVAEGTNLYFTDARADARIAAAVLTDIGNVNSPGALTAGNQMVVNGAGTGYTWVPQKKVLNDLNNVNAPSPNDGDYLQWDNTSSRWIPSPVITSASLAGLTDTNVGTPLNGQALVYDTATTSWIPGTTAAAVLTDIGNVNSPGALTAGNQMVVNGAGTGYTWVPQKKVLDDLNDVDLTTTAPANNDVLMYDGSNWVPGAGGGSSTLAGLTDVTPATVDGDVLTYNAASSSYEFTTGSSLTTPAASTAVADGEVLQWDVANDQLVPVDLYDNATGNRITREVTASQIIYRFN